MAKKFAKRARPPKSHARMKKRHFDMGGDVAASMDSFGGATAGPAMPDVGPMPDMPDLSGNQMPINTDLMTFGQAFKAARASGQPTFKWRGGSYGTTMDTGAPKSLPAKAKVPDQSIPEFTSTPERVLRPDQPSTSDRGPSGRYLDPEMQAYADSRPSVAQARAAARQNEIDAAKFLGGTALGGAGAGILGSTLALAGPGMGGATEGLAGAGRLANLTRGANMVDKTQKGRALAENLWRARTGAQSAAQNQATRPIQDIIRERALAGMGYKKGGKVETKLKKPMVEKMIGNKKKANPDGAEHKGHTKGKIVKMARGGHVGSTSSRADGIASRGKTRCKY